MAADGSMKEAGTISRAGITKVGVIITLTIFLTSISFFSNISNIFHIFVCLTSVANPDPFGYVSFLTLESRCVSIQ